VSRANNSHGQVITRRSFLGSAGALIGGLPLLGYSQNQRRAPQPLRATYLEAQYLPVLRLHPDDPYRPSTVSWLLPRAELRFKGHADPILKKGEVSPYNIHTRVFGGQTSGGGNRVTDFYLNYPDDSDRETTRRGNLDEFACYVHISRRNPFEIQLRNNNLRVPRSQLQLQRSQRSMCQRMAGSRSSFPQRQTRSMKLLRHRWASFLFTCSYAHLPLLSAIT